MKHLLLSIDCKQADNQIASIWDSWMNAYAQEADSYIDHFLDSNGKPTDVPWSYIEQTTAAFLGAAILKHCPNTVVLTEYSVDKKGRCDLFLSHKTDSLNDYYFEFKRWKVTNKTDWDGMEKWMDAYLNQADKYVEPSNLNPDIKLCAIVWEQLAYNDEAKMNRHLNEYFEYFRNDNLEWKQHVDAIAFIRLNKPDSYLDNNTTYYPGIFFYAKFCPYPNKCTPSSSRK